MTYLVERFDAREWPDEQLERLFADAFPPFITADPVARVYIDRVRKWFGEFNLMLVDAEDRPVATGWGVPIRWNGEPTDLPSGYTDTTRRAVELRTHVRAGGTIIATASHSQVMTGSVAEWETWTGLSLPSTGHYLIPNGLSTLYIDREQDFGTYVEGNVWVRHR